MIHKFSSGYETKPIIDILGFSAALSKLRLSIGIKITENQTAAVICDDFMILNFSFCVTKPQRLGNFKVGMQISTSVLFKMSDTLRPVSTI